MGPGGLEARQGVPLLALLLGVAIVRPAARGSREGALDRGSKPR